MEIRYAVVDANNNPVILYSHDYGEDLVKVPENKAVLFKMKNYAEGELNHIDRLLISNDYRNVSVHNSIVFPLRVAEVKYCFEII